MTEIKVRKGEPVKRAIRRLKKKPDREQTLQTARAHRRFEKPSAGVARALDSGPDEGNPDFPRD
jgi:small subunit ribosomal protein S21